MLPKITVPTLGLAVTLVPTIDVVLKCAQVGVAVGSFIFVCYQILDLYEKRKARRAALGRTASPNGLPPVTGKS